MTTNEYKQAKFDELEKYIKNEVNTIRVVSNPNNIWSHLKAQIQVKGPVYEYEIMPTTDLMYGAVVGISDPKYYWLSL